MKLTYFFVVCFFAFVLMSVPQAFSYEVIYPELDYKHTKIPNYCIVKPTDPELNEGQRDWMVQMAQDAVKEWNDTLQESFTHSYKWQLMSTEISDPNKASNCDWIMSFRPEISSFFTFGVVLGYADIRNQEIVIRYMDLDQEQFHDVLLHEIGHSLGLGHFTTDDYQVMSKWLNSESPPSIMIPNIHQNPGLTYITQVDVDKLREIYGTGGFLRDYEKESEDTKSNLQLGSIDALESLSVSPQEIVVKKYQNNMVTISGQLKKDLILSGVPFHLVTIRPDLTTEVSAHQVTSNGKFSIPISFTEDSPKGKYSIELVYRDRTVSYQSVNYWVKSEFSTNTEEIPQLSEESPAIPLWVKNTAQWWSDGLIEDSEFVNGVQFLVDQKIIFVPNISAKTSATSDEVPGWIKNTAGWWASGEISETEFLKGIEFLVKEGIIRVK